MRRRIALRCAACGNAMLVFRVDHEHFTDPPDAVELVTNECTICEAANGGWGESHYYDRDGHEVFP